MYNWKDDKWVLSTLIILFIALAFCLYKGVEAGEDISLLF
jgi:hypothetical protein